METIANKANMAIELRDRVSLDDVNWFSVVPAWIATKLGGATPNLIQKLIKIPSDEES